MTVIDLDSTNDATVYDPLARIIARARPVLDELAATAAARELGRQLPIDLVRQLTGTGIGALRIPREYGGAGLSLRELFDVIIEVSAADSNVGQALRAHFATVEALLASGDHTQRERWFPRIVAGAIVGNAYSERGTATLRTVQTTLRRDGDRLVLRGEKFYSTGTLYADLVSTAARTENETTAIILVPVDRDGVHLRDDWDGFGQRLSASGSTRFEDVVVTEDEILDHDWENSPTNHLVGFFQLYLAAVLAGIARNVGTDAVTLVRGRSRTYGHASAETPSQDPLVQQVIGDISAAAFAAETLVLAGADALDRAYATSASGTPDPDVHDQAALTVARAQVTVARLTLNASEALFNAGSASATDRSRDLDRHWRNARTLASHNPLIYKTRIIGDHVLNGGPLPRTGFL